MSKGLGEKIPEEVGFVSDPKTEGELLLLGDSGCSMEARKERCHKGPL